MTIQKQITETRSGKKKPEEVRAPLFAPPPTAAAEASLAAADDFAQEIASEQVGGSVTHQRVNQIDDERLYNEGDQISGQ